jgi:hypothetical protein
MGHITSSPKAFIGTLNTLQCCELTHWTLPALAAAYGRAADIARTHVAQALLPDAAGLTDASSDALTALDKLQLSRLEFWSVFSDFTRVVSVRKPALEAALATKLGESTDVSTFLSVSMSSFVVFHTVLPVEEEAAPVSSVAHHRAVLPHERTPAVSPSKQQTSHQHMNSTVRTSTEEAQSTLRGASGSGGYDVELALQLAGMPAAAETGPGGQYSLNQSTMHDDVPLPRVSAVEVFAALALLCDSPLDDRLAFIFQLFDTQRAGFLDEVGDVHQ